MPQFETDDYIDLVGRKWFCVADHKRKRMVCNSVDGYFTCASFDTFAVWRWKASTVAPANQPSAEAIENKGGSQ